MISWLEIFCRNRTRSGEQRGRTTRSEAGSIAKKRARRVGGPGPTTPEIQGSPPSLRPLVCFGNEEECSFCYSPDQQKTFQEKIRTKRNKDGLDTPLVMSNTNLETQEEFCKNGTKMHNFILLLQLWYVLAPSLKKKLAFHSKRRRIQKLSSLWHHDVKDSTAIKFSNIFQGSPC